MRCRTLAVALVIALVAVVGVATFGVRRRGDVRRPALARPTVRHQPLDELGLTTAYAYLAYAVVAPDDRLVARWEGGQIVCVRADRFCVSVFGVWIVVLRCAGKYDVRR